VVCALIGLGVIAAAAPPSTHGGAVVLTTNPNYYIRLQLDLFSGGTVTVTFATTSGGTFTIWVMTDAQHTAFISTGVLNYLATDSGASGTFVASLPSGGRYFVEVGHGTGFENQAETGEVTASVNAWSSGPVEVGIGAFVVAAVLILIGLWLRARPEKVRGYPLPPPYVPAQYPPYGGSPPGTAWGPYAAPPGTPPATPGTAAILVTVDNRTANDEAVQVLLNGSPAVSLTVPAGKAGQAHVRAPAPPPPGATVRVEIVTGSGARAAQDVLVAADGNAQVALQIG